MKLARKKTILPFYHFVDNGSNNFVNHLYQPKTKAQFIKDIQYFKKHFNSISVDNLEGTQSKKKYNFLLSFDDGLSNFYHVVVPILLKEKVSAINFLNSNFIDNKDLFYRYKVNLLIEHTLNVEIPNSKREKINTLFKLKLFNSIKICELLKKLTLKDEKIIDNLSEILEVSFSEFLNFEKPYLDEKQIVELLQKEFFIGAHSKNHPRYALIFLESQLKETLESVNEVKEKFNLKHNYFSFPFSDDGVSKAFFNKIKHKNIITFGSSGLKDEALENHYQRIPMEYNSTYSAETIVKGELVYYILKRFFGFHKIKRS